MNSFLPSLAITLSLVLNGYADVPNYTSAQIEEMIRTSVAKPHGAGFANQGVGCTSYLIKQSDKHHLFVFRRDGRSYGEFRDEVLSKGRFLSIYERYLVAKLRNAKSLAPAKKIRYICKETKLAWKNGAVVSSTVRWSFLTADVNGHNFNQEAVETKQIVRGVVSVIIPDEFTPHGETFFLGLERAKLTRHENAFGSINPVLEHFGLVNGRCSIWAEWPKDDPTFNIILRKKIPNPPHDANLSLTRTKYVSSMKISLDPPKNVPFVFYPN